MRRAALVGVLPSRAISTSTRPNALVIEWFDKLGYYYDARRTEAMRNPRLREQLRDNRTHRVYGWFATSVMLFVRRTPLRGCALVS